MTTFNSNLMMLSTYLANLKTDCEFKNEGWEKRAEKNLELIEATIDEIDEALDEM